MSTYHISKYNAANRPFVSSVCIYTTHTFNDLFLSGAIANLVEDEFPYNISRVIMMIMIIMIMNLVMGIITMIMIDTGVTNGVQNQTRLF